MSPKKTKAKSRKNGRSGSRKAGAKKPKAVRSKRPASDARRIEVTPFEEADGFQIFRVAKAAKKRDAASSPPPAATTGVKEKDSAPPRARVGAWDEASSPDSGVAAQPTAASNGTSTGDSVGRWMVQTIDSIVREEMRLAVARITRSVIRETRADGSSKG